SLWFDPIKPITLQGDLLTLEVRDEFCAIWLTNNYLDLLRSAASRAAVRPIKIEFVVAQPGTGLPVLPPNGAGVTTETASEAAIPHPNGRAIDSAFNHNSTFSSFVVGSNNQMAHSASIAVAQSPGRAFNPLFLQGGVGLGKTHLLNAIGQEILDRRKSSKVVYTSCERFTNEFIDALQNNQLARFRRRYRQVDALLVDDVQFLAGKERIQEEFFHTFNTLHQARKQIVLSCDRLPSEIPGLEARLVSRFEWGMTADLQPPDVETRMAILRKKEALMKTKLDPKVLQYLADHIRSNVRRLEGAFLRVASFGQLVGRGVQLDDVEILLREILQEERRQTLTIEAIQKRVAEHFDIRLSDMTSKRRPESIAFPRQVAMALSRQLTDASLSQIGDAFGGRDHGTVLHACRAVKNRMEVDAQVRQTVGYLEKQLMR
ncbi:MAG TPA: chromosomal replication initiator protein DnaA, partial [Verrucomicrobiales bacterium]|nr:chromosomal replication initiator protein DnaA [Verrucomicrobiales bacterium]